MEHRIRTIVSGLALAGIAAVSVGMASAPAQAATQAVSITANGFVPKDLTVLVGDTVAFTNNDTAAHQVDFKGAAGVTCSASPLVIQAGQSGSCTFASAGNFAYSDPNRKGNTFRGSVTVSAPSTTGSATIAASAPLVVYGTKVNLTGKIAPVKGNVTVNLLARPFPESAFAAVASVASGGDGSYAFSVPPQVRTEYKVAFVDGSTKGESPAVTVQVRPKVTLTVVKVAGGKVTLKTGVVSTLTYAGKPVLVQRRNSTGGWTTIRTVKLGQFSTATFASPAPSGTTKWRTYLQASQAGGGYEPSYSRTVRVVR